MIVALFIGMAALGAGDTIVTGPVETVAEGFKFTEGPVWLPTGDLIFSDIPADTIYKADRSIFRHPTNNTNGQTLDQEGRVIACEHSARRVVRIEKDGKTTILADSFEGKKLNSPNDAVVRSDGAIFFTDPPYGIPVGQKQELQFQGVYMISPSGAIKALGRDFLKPNGIALSLDEKTLYVADTDGNHVRAFDLADDGTASNGRVFCELPKPDGLRLDQKGNIWCTADDGVRVFTPAGALLHTVKVPQIPANCAFGGADGKTLYITARTGLYKVRCTTPGAAVPIRK